MKKIIISIAVVLFGITAVNSQTVNEMPIHDIDVTYIQIVGMTRLLSNKVNIHIDFGQNTQFFNDGKETQIKDENGKLLKFNSMIDALNFMESNGYNFVQAYALLVDGQKVHHYIMKKANQ